MTNDRMALAEFIEDGSNADLLREMTGFVSQRLMDCDVQSLCAARCGEHSPERASSRDGYRERVWETRAGTIPLNIPMLRQGSRSPVMNGPKISG